MSELNGGGAWGCAFAVAGAALAFGALVTTPVGAVAAAAWSAAGYSLAVPGLASCFSDKF